VQIYPQKRQEDYKTVDDDLVDKRPLHLCCPCRLSTDTEIPQNVKLSNMGADSKDALLKKVAEAELQDRIRELEKNLREAKQALSQMGGDHDDVYQNGHSYGTIISKRGYLFKWQDRYIGWGGTKWALRFVSLEQGKISYYQDHTDASPRYVLTLCGCAVRDEGLKRNKRHVKKYGEGVGPSVDEVGAYFHVFSIYQRRDFYEDMSDDDATPPEVVPLLRFSTPSLAEKTQWIKLISDACEFCDTEDFLAAEKAALVEAEKRKAQEQEMRKAMPEATPGTLPPLYFAPVNPPPLKRLSIGQPLHKRLYRTKSGHLDAEKVESRSTKGYPPSKPMHRQSAPSYLSAEGPVQSYRGFFNLAMILLVVSNLRMLSETIRREGFILARLSHSRMPSLTTLDWTDAPFFSGLLLFQLFIVITYMIERVLAKRVLKEGFGMFLHYSNAHCCLVVSIAIVWRLVENPAVGALLLVHGTITWMKLLSYAHANQDYRLSNDVDTYKATLALVEDLDPGDANLSYPR
jgi:hypothetical protein